MKKKLRIILFLSLLACLLCVSANAGDAPVIVEHISTGIIQNGDFPEAPQPGPRMYASAQSADDMLAEAKEALKKGLLSVQDRIDISQCGISTDKIDEVKDIFVQVINENPELFFVGNGFHYYERDGVFTAIAPYYQLDGTTYANLTEEQKSQIRQKQTALEQVVNGILAQVDPKWSDLETALFLHDYLATHAQYDETLQIRDAYTILVKGTGVCQAYTLAYRLLLNRVNITSGTVTSTALNHIWNILLIDDKWYHVDVTWDDPTQDRIGRVTHRYFCTSEARREAVLKESRKNWTNWTFVQDWEYSPNDITADNTRFDSSYWANVDSAFVPLNGAWYYLAYQNGIMRTEAPEQQGKLKKRIDERWYVWGSTSSRWLGLYSGLSRYNDALIYNTPDAVYSYDPENAKEAQAVYTLTPEERSKGYIYGTVVDGNVLRYAVQQDPDHSMSTYTHRLDPYTTVTAGGYAYYLEGKTLYLKLSGTQSGSVIAAWYSEEDKLLGILILNEGELTADVSDAKTVKIFAAANTDYHPLCEATVRTIG